MTQPEGSIPRETWESYRSTLYWVEAPGERICLRVGEPSPPLDALLAASGASEWAFITAWNPFSQPLSGEENAVRQRALVAEAAPRYRILPAAGVGVDGWREPSLLLLGIPRVEAAALGRRWEQNAILVGRRGGPAEMVALRPVEGA